ncbi:MAG: glycoside hydrolase family 15 protein [Polyangia bacterium]
MSTQRLAVVLCSAALLVAAHADASPTPVPSFSSLPTGNGFGFSVFDASAHKVTTFLERPYKYLGPGADPHGEGIYRRDLAYDVYFGARVGATAQWLPDAAQTSAGYVDQAGIVRSVASVGNVKIESYFYEPYGLSQNALVMIARATNTGSGPTTVDLFALPNFRLGAGGDDPSPNGETITTTGARSIETGSLGEAGGAMIYLPLAPIAKADCNGDGYAAVNAGSDLPSDTRSCTGDDRTLIFQSTQLSLAAGETKSFGILIGFSPTISGAGAVGDAMATFVGARPPDQILSDSQTEWESWRKPPPSGLSSDETIIYRQAESTLRMAQVLEPYGPTLKNHGMILASLPPGIWHIGWVRDATYATVALAQSGHIAEAKDSLRFLLSATANGYDSYTNGSYRISITRYFGNGLEETDWNSAGPNIELDGWGLFLWALRQTMDAEVSASGGTTLLSETLPTGETFLDEVRSGVVQPLQRNLESSGLVLPDTSIWESHWDNRKHYAFTSLAAARGLCDVAAIEQHSGDASRADMLRLESTQLTTAIRVNMLDSTQLLGGSQEGVAGGTYHDGAVLEAFNWELYPATDPLYAATLTGLDFALKTGSSGWKRNDDHASSYDSNEWVFIDMRAASAFRRTGDAARADEIVAWVTAQARANYDLIPELFNTFASDGPLWSYTGATPMVGFGAGAYILALRQRAGQVEKHDCGIATVPPSGDGGLITTDGGTPKPTKKTSGCGCAVGGREDVRCPPLAMFALLAAALCWRAKAAR